MNRDLEGEKALLEVSRLQRDTLGYDLEKLETESDYNETTS